MTDVTPTLLQPAQMGVCLVTLLVGVFAGSTTLHPITFTLNVTPVIALSFSPLQSTTSVVWYC